MIERLVLVGGARSVGKTEIVKRIELEMGNSERDLIVADSDALFKYATKIARADSRDLQSEFYAEAKKRLSEGKARVKDEKESRNEMDPPGWWLKPIIWEDVQDFSTKLLRHTIRNGENKLLILETHFAVRSPFGYLMGLDAKNLELIADATFSERGNADIFLVESSIEETIARSRSKNPGYPTYPPLEGIRLDLDLNRLYSHFYYNVFSRVFADRKATRKEDDREGPISMEIDKQQVSHRSYFNSGLGEEEGPAGVAGDICNYLRGPSGNTRRSPTLVMSNQ